MNKVKTIATIGPATKDKEILERLITNGVDLVRFNMNYASQEFCDEVIKNLKKIDKELNCHTGIIIDLKGPIIRIGKLSSKEAQLIEKTKIRIYSDPMVGDHTAFSVDCPELIKKVKYDTALKINDGNVELRVIDKEYNYILCEVVKGGLIKENQKLVAPDLNLKMPYLSKEDIETIRYADKIKADYLALSFVSCSEDVLKISDELIEINNDHLGILAKIETKDAVENIDEIVDVSDGVIIARGELGISLPIERIPGIQKSIINKCHKQGKISAVMTELLSSMEEDSNLTKAEVSDVANAVLDGADAVILCGETTTGKFPVETLIMMEKILRSAETDINYVDYLDRTSKSENNDITGVLSRSIVECANSLECKAIVVPTTSGFTAKRISRFHPSCPIIAITPNKGMVKSLRFYFGIEPVLITDFETFDEVTKKAKEICIDLLGLKKHDCIIVTGSYPLKKVAHTNFIKIEEI